MLLDKKTYIITFERMTPADANRYAEELRNALLDATTDITVQRKRENPQTQDFGSTLVLILGTPALSAVVTAVSQWLLRRRNASLTWKTADGEVIVQNINSQNACELARKLLKRP